jgi:hypothetical protein
VSAGRNDPCPCGSGQKYKKCCLEKQAARPAPALSDRLRQPVMAALLRYAKRESTEDQRAVARAAFQGAALDGVAEEDLGRLDDLDWGVKHAFFLLYDFPLAGGSTLAQRYLAEREGRLPEDERTLIQRFSESVLRPYEVLDVVLDSGLVLRDLWAGHELRVSERMATRQVRRWDLLAARVVPDDGALVFEGGLYRYPPRLAGELMAALRKEHARLRRRNPGASEELVLKRCSGFLHQFWLVHVAFPPRPRVVTAEGDPLEFGRVVYDIVDPAALRQALARSARLVQFGADSYDWFEAAGRGHTRTLGSLAIEGQRLILEVASRERAARGRAMLGALARSAIRYRTTRYESLDHAMARRRRSRDAPEDPEPPPEAAALIAEMQAEHYRTWPDIPLPALGGRTPRHAARLKTIRPRLIELLKDMQNSEAASPGGPAYDFGHLWRELGLERDA